MIEKQLEWTKRKILYYQRWQERRCPKCGKPKMATALTCLCSQCYKHLGQYDRQILSIILQQKEKISTTENIRRNILKQLLITNLAALKNKPYSLIQKSITKSTNKKNRKHSFNQDKCITNLRIKSYKLYKTQDKWLDLYEILEKQNFKCPYSGYILEIGKNASLDHIKPISRGGSNDLSNLQWIDTEVNMMKRDNTHDEFLVWIKFLYNKNFS